MMSGGSWDQRLLRQVMSELTQTQALDPYAGVRKSVVTCCEVVHVIHMTSTCVP